MNEFSLLESPNWQDYALLDSGNGLKLERFGPYTFVRPEVQAMWSRALPEKEWATAHAVFKPVKDESGGFWQFSKSVNANWKMRYPLRKGEGQKARVLKFYAMTTHGRHLGVFPECAANWDWMAEQITKSEKPLKILNLFGYTGLATLACAAAGAQVTHVDASKTSVGLARKNQVLSGLVDLPVRWLVDDALKFVQREARRGGQYDGIVLDPPKFGRGPRGEVWEMYKSLPRLLQACREILKPKPLFVVLTIYAVQASAIDAGQTLADIMKSYGGQVEMGELVTREQAAGRLLSQAVYARWSE